VGTLLAVLAKKLAEDGEISPARHPAAHRFAVQPIGPDFGNPAEEIDHGPLGAEQPERPGRSGLRAETRAQPGIERPGALRGKEDQQKADETDEIEVVEVSGLIEQKQ